jgi:sporulation protein YlmC with PRC-barrel domain
MFRKYLTAALLGTALVGVPALAQTSVKTPDAKMNSAAQAQSGQWRSSKLIGVNVYNNKNEKIGDISDMLLDQNGQIQAVVLGVGGFLGMGEHFVAVKFEQLKWVNEPARNTTTSNNATPAATATNTQTTTGSAVASNDKTNSMYPDHAVFNATKDQLKSMPEYKYAK